MQEPDLGELRKRQLEISGKAVLRDKTPGKIRTIGGFDAAYSGKRACSAGVVLDFGTLEVVEERVVKTGAKFPYIPTYLSFREGPLIADMYERLEVKPDVLMINGQGIAHPLGAGLATHVGVELNKPTVGVAQKRLVGNHSVPGNAGDHTRLLLRGRQVGWVVKTKKNCNPIFVSPGHMVSLDKSLRIAEACAGGWKLPEPLRLAHRLSKSKSI